MSGRKQTKRGWSADELAELRRRVELGQSVDELAAALGRPPETVVRAIARECPDAATKGAAEAAQAAVGEAPPSPRDKVLADLHGSELWRQVKASFFPAEQRFYEAQWCEMLEQFDGNVLATEKVQVHDAVTLSVLKHRNLAAQRECMERRKAAEAEWERLDTLWPLAGPGQAVIRDELIERSMENLLDRANKLTSQLTSLVREHSDLDDKHRKVFESLKSTREQRVERLTKQVSFQDLMKTVLAENKRAEEGQRAELMKQVGRRTAAQLARPIKLEDGTVDSPLFSPDTVGGVYDPTPLKGSASHS